MANITHPSTHFTDVIIVSVEQPTTRDEGPRFAQCLPQERYVREGTERFGIGKWKEIRDAYPFLSCRIPHDIKDKWRNMNK